MRPDFKKTVTGWKFTDWLTGPYWTLLCWYQGRRLHKLVGSGDAKRGEEIMRQAFDELTDKELRQILEAG